MMDLPQIIWLVVNIVFGLSTSRNFFIYFYAKLFNRRYIQSGFGHLIDMFVLSSILIYIIYHKDNLLGGLL